MRFVFFIFILFHFSERRKHFYFVRLWKTLLDCKQNVGAEIGTLMSNSEGLGPYLFCRKMQIIASYVGRGGWKGCLYPA